MQQSVCARFRNAENTSSLFSMKGFSKVFTVEKRVVIGRPLEEVFAFIADQRNAPQWQAGLVEVRVLTDDPVGVGTKHAIVRLFMDQRMEISNEYTEYTLNQKVAFKSTSGPIPFNAAYMTEPVAEGTHLISMVQMQPEGLPAEAEAEMNSGLSREIEADLATLKKVLES